jgi:hypothetical protein
MLFPTTILSAILALSASVFAAPTPDANSAVALEARATYLGGLDMDQTCRDQWFRFAYVVKSGDTCNSWTCREDIEYGVAGLYIDTPRACVQRYGAGATAKCTGGANGWGCYRG